jgi:hypothetical protein
LWFQISAFNPLIHTGPEVSISSLLRKHLPFNGPHTPPQKLVKNSIHNLPT